MTEHVFSGQVKKGCFYPDALPRWNVTFGKLEGKRVTVKVESYRDVRSLAQNRRYFSCVVPVVAEVLSQELPQGELPVSKDEAHEKLKEHFIGFRVTSLGKVPKRSRDLNTEQFAAFVRAVEEWLATKWGIVIPERGEDLS